MMMGFFAKRSHLPKLLLAVSIALVAGVLLAALAR